MSVSILIGDCRARLRELPAESVQCVVTSPPYFGLRDYQVDGQVGLEDIPDAYVATLVEVFREVRRVLRADGTAWLNLGDAYNSGTDKGRRYSATNNKNHGYWVNQQIDRRIVDHNTKPKDLLMMPARIAIGLRDDGWYLRSEIVWAKPNPMPESVTDRPTSAHEKVFLLTKSPRYFYDAEAVRLPPAESSVVRWNQNVEDQQGSMRAHAGAKTNGSMKAVGGPRRSDKQRGHSRRHDGFNDRWDAMPKAEQIAMGANLRNVWEIATRPYSEAHFATFPPALAERCIKAGSRECDTVLDPFGGAGTTGLVADRLGRDAILIELNPEYAAMAERRIHGDAGMFATVEVQACKS